MTSLSSVLCRVGTVPGSRLVGRQDVSGAGLLRLQDANGAGLRVWKDANRTALADQLRAGGRSWADRPSMVGAPDQELQGRPREPMCQVAQRPDGECVEDQADERPEEQAANGITGVSRTRIDNREGDKERTKRRERSHDPGTAQPEPGRYPTGYHGMLVREAEPPWSRDQ